MLIFQLAVTQFFCLPVLFYFFFFAGVGGRVLYFFLLDKEVNRLYNPTTKLQ